MDSPILFVKKPNGTKRQPRASSAPFTLDDVIDPRAAAAPAPVAEQPAAQEISATEFAALMGFALPESAP